MTTYRFAIIDHSSECDRLPEHALERISEAIKEQLNNEFSSFYGGDYYIRVCDASSRKDTEIAVNIRDSLPGMVDALGYHFVTNGVPDIEIGLEYLSDLTKGYDSLSVVMSHEVLEVIGDPGANLWVDRGDGTMRARELCDAVEDTTYLASNGVEVSNFLLPAAFIPKAQGPWDYLKILWNASAITDGGYDIVARSPTDVQKVTAMYRTGFGSPLGQWRTIGIEGASFEEGSRRYKRKTHPFSRTSRRGIRL